MKQDVGLTLEVSCLELLSRAYTHSDREDWATFQLRLEETVLSWLHKHPGYKSVSRVQSDKVFIALAFERLWQAVIQRQVTCESERSHSGDAAYLFSSKYRQRVRISRSKSAICSTRPGGVELGSNPAL